MLNGKTMKSAFVLVSTKKLAHMSCYYAIKELK